MRAAQRSKTSCFRTAGTSGSRSPSSWRSGVPTSLASTDCPPWAPSSARPIHARSARRANCCHVRSCSYPASGRRARRPQTWPARSRVALRARSSASRGTSSTRSGFPGWTGAARPPPRRRSTPATCGPCRAGSRLDMDPGRRRELTRYGAPAAFLLAVTIAALLVKSGLDNGSQDQTVAAPTTTARTTTTAPTTTITLTSSTTATTAPANAQYYVIESGDTLGAVAAKYDTTLDELLTLNPSVDPSGLQPGQRIRVG